MIRRRLRMPEDRVAELDEIIFDVLPADHIGLSAWRQFRQKFFIDARANPYGDDSEFLFLDKPGDAIDRALHDLGGRGRRAIRHHDQPRLIIGLAEFLVILFFRLELIEGKLYGLRQRRPPMRFEFMGKFKGFCSALEIANVPR